MATDDRSLRSVHEEAESKREALENSFSSNSASFQDSLAIAIELYEQCLSIAQRISLFSPNEPLEEIATADLKYLLLNYRVAELVLRSNRPDRRAILDRAQRGYRSYLTQLDQYDVLNKNDSALLEAFLEAPASFSITSTQDAATRRDMKIKRFKEEKVMKEKLQYMQKNPSILQNDDNTARNLYLTQVLYCTHQTFQSLEGIAQEMHILSLAPPIPPPTSSAELTDSRERDRRAQNGYSERLDPPLSHLSAGMRGPLIDDQGKPLRPFTLTSKRQEFTRGVFRPDHSLPTMSIDEYLEEERRRGGMIDGGGPQSQERPQVDEDDMEAADRETMKAREWDEYVEANPKGSGNTLNRG